MDAQIVGGLGHQGIERRIAGEAENTTPSSSAHSMASTRP
jgi:hypothetical protein